MNMFYNIKTSVVISSPSLIIEPSKCSEEAKTSHKIIQKTEQDSDEEDDTHEEDHQIGGGAAAHMLHSPAPAAFLFEGLVYAFISWHALPLPCLVFKTPIKEEGRQEERVRNFWRMLCSPRMV